jgi:hypothetical protein
LEENLEQVFDVPALDDLAMDGMGVARIAAITDPARTT